MVGWVPGPTAIFDRAAMVNWVPGPVAMFYRATIQFSQCPLFFLPKASWSWKELELGPGSCAAWNLLCERPV